MKEPKYQKFQDNHENQKYGFIQEGIVPEKEDIKKLKNKSSKKEAKRPPFSLPAELEQKKPPNTQNDDDLLPFFAKDYPSSDEEKEEICFINSPIPSETSNIGGEAEEVEGIEEEDNQNSNEKNQNLKNLELGQSIDFNSELEAQQEKPSNYLSREEVLAMYNRQQEKNREEERKLEEERKKKEAERKKKEEERKKKEEEEKRKIEEEKKKKLLEEKRKKIAEEEKKREKEELERKKKEKKDKELERKRQEEEKKKEMDKKKKEEEEERMKKLKSGKKNDPFYLSSIKKYPEDNIASNSMLNEVKQFFPGAIPEENAENEEDEDYSKKNFKKNTKDKNAKKEPLSQKDKKEENKKSKSKKVSDFNEKLKKDKNSKKIIEEEKEDEKEEEKEEEKKEEKGKKEEKNKSQNNNRNKKKSSRSKKSNGLGVGEKPKISTKNESQKRNFDDNDENEEFSDYGDELQSSDSDVPKKQKIKVKDPNFPRLPKKLVRDKFYSENQELLKMYHAQEKIKLFTYDIEQQKEPRGFGINGRYSLRTRIPPLRKEFGERAIYVYTKNGPELRSVEKVSNPYAGFNYISNKAKSQIEEKIKKKKKKLVKGEGVIPEENNSDYNSEGKDQNDNEENKDDYNSDNLDSQGFSEYGEDEARFLKIPKGGKKNAAKNYDTLLIIKVHEAQGKNMIKVDKKVYKDLKSGDNVRVNKNQIYEILNFSDYDLIVQLLLDEEDN